ncbi:TAXI family TRAP transporter solute-binding subunit [Halalkalibacter oceani]|uniref:TAXI family TRAP transporter solute-binding subunit n=1 Tax=Halalkalibacter oceani TaxID=1653776 RepID=A0A9X2IMK8_9BACI|nr:TAXI family TRAP transporter solute-binding subunit [Halalkalibacter oceani]MCM3713989.1 TAXI family TRAP transporter solute-binding subunit [Halalkalibacter oceani]
MKKSKLYLFVTLLVMAMLLVMTACGNDQAANENEAEAPAAENEASDESGEEAGEGETVFPDRMVVGASAPGGSFYTLGGVMGTLIDQELGIPASVEDTGGGVANVQLAHQGELTLGLTANFEAYDFYYEQGMDGFGTVAPIFNQGLQLVVNADSSIESWGDLEGANIALSRANTTHDIAGRAILETLGIEPNQIINAGNDDINSMFRDGRVDAMLLVSSFPTSAFSEVDVTTPLRLIPLAQDEVEQVIEANPYLGQITIPGGVYEGTPDDTLTVSVWSLFVAPKSVSDDVIYELTKIIYDNKSTFQDGVSAVTLDPEDVVELRAPLHPGALRYYEELEIEIPDQIKPE